MDSAGSIAGRMAGQPILRSGTRFTFTPFMEPTFESASERGSGRQHAESVHGSAGRDGPSGHSPGHHRRLANGDGRP